MLFITDLQTILYSTRLCVINAIVDEHHAEPTCALFKQLVIAVLLELNCYKQCNWLLSYHDVSQTLLWCNISQTVSQCVHKVNSSLVQSCTTDAIHK